MIGASTRSFGGKTVTETARLFRDFGLECAELCFCQTDLSGWRYNFCGRAQMPPMQDIKNAVSTFRAHGISVCSLGFYGCFFTGTDSDLCDTVRSFADYCEAASLCDIKSVSLHTGTFTIQPMVSRGYSAEHLKKLHDGLMLSCAHAKRSGVTVALECARDNAVCGYKGFLELRDIVGNALGDADMLKYICNPADDTAFPKLSDTELCHIRDRKRNGRFYEHFGDGDVDFTAFFAEIKEHPDIPLILEYINSGNAARTAAELRRCLEGTGDRN